MSTLVKTLYDTDYVEWVGRTAQLIRERRFDEIDVENLAEEVEGLAGSLQSAVRSQLRRMLMHLIKQKIQPDRDCASWRASIANAQVEILNDIKSSPSLRRFARDILDDTYRDAVRIALIETDLEDQSGALNIPEQCPYTIDQLLATDVASLWRK
jgi:hypothetical protein